MPIAFAREKRREERGHQARLGELDRQTGKIVLGLPLPGRRADFEATDEDAVAGNIAAGVVFGCDANRCRLHREGELRIGLTVRSKPGPQQGARKKWP